MKTAAVRKPLPGGLEELSEQLRRSLAPKILEVPWHATVGRSRCRGWIIETTEDEPREVVMENEMDGGGGCISWEIAQHIAEIHNLVIEGHIRREP
jgi:hypothetical protein